MQTRRRKDSGFALLLIFLMASMIAISLYVELPRAAFQAERQREQLLMERGEQYKRAIGLFLRTNKNTRWPATVEELENFNNRRSLRRRYIDPLTGKDEWRLIHIQNGVLTDSIINKPSNSQNQQAGLIPSGMINELQGFGQQTGSQQAVNPGTRRRASDGGVALGPDGQPLPAGSADGFSGGVAPGLPGAPPGYPTGVPTGIQNAPGMGGIPGYPTGASGQTGQPNNPNSGSGGLMGGGLGGLMGGGIPTQSTGQPNGLGGVPGFPAGGIPGSSGAQNNGQSGIQASPSAQSAAAGLLQNLLTQPRPGGLQGIISAQGQGAIMGGGIAGVASKAGGESIMVYGDRSDFAEWEFIYDPIKFKVPPNPSSSSASGIGVPASQLGSNAGMSAPGTAIGTGPGGTQATGGQGGMGGGASGFNSGASGFGSTPGGAGGAFGASAGGFGMGGASGSSPGTSQGASGGANTFGTSSTLGGSASTAGSSGSTGSTGGSTAPGGGSNAFGQAGLPDIRPGKK
jgi:hypothetical protein